MVMANKIWSLAMARLVFREFDASKPTYARRAFIANGHGFKVGDVFDWRRMAVSQRRAKQMFEAGWIKHDTESDKKAPEPVVIEPEIAVKDKVSFEPQIVVEDNLDAIDDMKELRRIADKIGAPYKVSKADQRLVIREHMNKEAD